MATVRTIGTDALQELGVLGEDEALSASQGAFVLRRFQLQLDAWAADRLTLSRQLRTTFTLASGASSVTLGPSPSDVVMVAPMYLNTATYLVPGASPVVECPIAILSDDQYAAVRVKALNTALPQWCYYQVNLGGGVGTLTFPPTTPALTIAIYTPEAIGVPLSLQTDVTGPSGYAEAFLYQLALRCCNAFGVQPSAALVDLAAKAYATLKRANVHPGILGQDLAVTRGHRHGGYHVLTDQ